MESLWIAIIGVVGTLAASLVPQWLIMKKEADRWEREQEAKEEDRIRVAGEHLRQIYSNSILFVSDFISGAATGRASEEQARVVQEAHRWIALLSLHIVATSEEPAATFDRRYRQFTRRPVPGNATVLLKSVTELARNDRTLCPEGVPMAEEPEGTLVILAIDREFRGEQFVTEGEVLPSAHAFNCDLPTLSQNQRQKLWNVYGGMSRETLTGGITLLVPTKCIIGADTQVHVQKGSSWEARVNPLKLKDQDIFDAWEADYDRALEQAQKEPSGESQEPGEE